MRRTFRNNSATGDITKGIGDGAGADCVCVWQDSPGVPSPAGQCVGCRPQDNAECHAVAGKPQPGQPDFFCPGPRPWRGFWAGAQ